MHQGNMPIRNCLILLWSVNHLLIDFLHSLENGDEVANTETKAHCGFKFLLLHRNIRLCYEDHRWKM
jgi:hypothetical protein